MSSSITENESCESGQHEPQASERDQNITGIKLELAPLGLWEYQPATGLFEFGDDFYAIYGTSIDREGRFMTLEKYVREFICREDAEMVQEMITNLLELQNLSTVEYHIIRRDGVVRTIRVWGGWKGSRGSLGGYKIYGVNQDVTEYKIMEAELHRSRTQLILATKLACLGAWEYDVNTGLFEFGDEFYAIYGTSVEKEGRFMTPETYVREFVYPEDMRMVQDAMIINSAPAQSTTGIEHRIIRRDGVIRTIRVWGARRGSQDSSGDYKIYGANQDVTEYKVMEEELRSSRNQLSIAAKLAQMGPWEYNEKTGLFEFSDEFYAVYGTTMALEGRFMTPKRYVTEFVHSEDVKMVQEAMITCISPAKVTTSAEHRIIRRDGEVRTIRARWGAVTRDSADNIEKRYGVNQDITERILAENALRESEERQKATLNAIPDMLLRMDALGKLFDYRIPDNYSGHLIKLADTYNSVDDILPTPLARSVKKLVISTLRQGKTKITNYSGQTNDSTCYFTIRSAPINKNEVLVIIQDQTVLYQAQREVQRLDNLNLIGEMAASIGHELRNPLTTVRGYLQFLSGKEQFKDQFEIFQVMIGELDRTNSIITEFLALAKNKAINMEPTNINSIINAIYPLIEVEATSENKVICLQLEHELPDIQLDKSEFKQLLINLVRNGLEAMISNGRLTITTVRDKQDVVLSVRDEGPGIPDSVIEKIGTPFITTKEQGTGLGLSICYSIAARNDANIDFTTGSDGTEFVIRFKGE